MTRFLIAKQIGLDAYRTIVGLCDGYLEHTGFILLEHYNAPERVDELLDLGDIYYLGKNLEWPDGTTFDEKRANKDGTMAFTRDFGDEGFDSKVLTFKELDSPKSRNEYVYIFTEANQWSYFKHGMSEYGLLDLRDSVDRVINGRSSIDLNGVKICEPIHEDVYVYKNRKNQSAAQIQASNNRIQEYLKSKGYENGGSISISLPMSSCGSNYQDMIQYCQEHSISRIIVEDMKALGDNSETANHMLDSLCVLGFTVEIAESGMVYTPSPGVERTDTAVRDAIQNYMVFEEETSTIYPFASTYGELPEEIIQAIIAKCNGYTDTETIYAAVDSVVGTNPVLGMTANETQMSVCEEMEEMQL